MLHCYKGKRKILSALKYITGQYEDEGKTVCHFVGKTQLFKIALSKDWCL